jgi:hypothetical protein
MSRPQKVVKPPLAFVPDLIDHDRNGANGRLDVMAGSGRKRNVRSGNRKWITDFDSDRDSRPTSAHAIIRR